MSGLPVEWVLAVHYGLAAHKATYGRLPGTQYAKDYIQLYRNPDFIQALEYAFPDLKGQADAVPIVFRWPDGSSPGTLFRKSADRPHLTWETKKKGAPAPWRMAKTVNQHSVETIPGDPSHLVAPAANAEYEALMASGIGLPYLIAVKLRGEQNTIHLRAYINEPSAEFEWASTQLLPPELRVILTETSDKRALAWRVFDADTVSGEILFDPTKNRDCWGLPLNIVLPEAGVVESGPASSLLDADALAEAMPVVDADVEAFGSKIQDGKFEVADTFASAKTRGSAQRAFSDRVKKNYEGRCAISGISTKGFLIGAHIVPWSKDTKSRLDPANGICLSVLFDKAFELGHITIEDDLTIRVNWEKVGDDSALTAILKDCDGKKIRAPQADPPKADFLKRRRDLFTAS
jgi:hypothetical protein